MRMHGLLRRICHSTTLLVERAPSASGPHMSDATLVAAALSALVEPAGRRHVMSVTGVSAQDLSQWRFDPRCVDAIVEAGLEFDDLVTALKAPGKRIGKSDGDCEHHLYEGAVMFAYAMHLLRAESARDISIHPDGQHGKQFDFAGWLGRQKFTMVSSRGSTEYGGTYRNSADQTVTVFPKPGLGDIAAKLGDRILTAECKGGIINTRHGGQLSKLRQGLCECVGQLMTTPLQGRQVAVVPRTESTLRLARKLAPRCALAGIEIALVGSRGEVSYIKREGSRSLPLR